MSANSINSDNLDVRIILRTGQYYYQKDNDINDCL